MILTLLCILDPLIHVLSWMQSISTSLACRREGASCWGCGCSDPGPAWKLLGIPLFETVPNQSRDCLISSQTTPVSLNLILQKDALNVLPIVPQRVLSYMCVLGLGNALLKEKKKKKDKMNREHTLAQNCFKPPACTYCTLSIGSKGTFSFHLPEN